MSERELRTPATPAVREAPASVETFLGEALVQAQILKHLPQDLQTAFREIVSERELLRKDVAYAARELLGGTVEDLRERRERAEGWRLT